MLSLFFGLALAAQTPPATQQPPGMEGMRYVTLGFLTTAPDAPALEGEALNKLQTAHLKYLQGLWENRRALLVGPLQDGGEYRGVVVLDMDQSKAQELMAKDPYVAAGHMGFKSFSWYCMPSVFKKAPQFLDIEPHWFVVLEAPETPLTLSTEERQKLGEGHMANINKMAEEGLLLSAGPLKDADRWRGIFIFRGAPKATIEAAMARDPMIQQGALKPIVWPWSTARGSFGKP